MKKPVLLCGVVLASFLSSCATDHREVPADQANKMRQHRVAPSEDISETERPTQGSPLPAANDSSWKF